LASSIVASGWPLAVDFSSLFNDDSMFTSFPVAAEVSDNIIENAAVGIVRGDTTDPSSSQISGNTFSNVNTDIRSISSGDSSGT
jgi:hypothetical protein